MSFYMFPRFKSDNEPHLISISPYFYSSTVLPPFHSQTCFYQFRSFSSALTTSFFCYIFYGLQLFYISSSSRSIAIEDIIFCNALFSFLVSRYIFPSSLLQYLCARGHCCGCRCPAHSRKQSTRRGHGARTLYSLGTVCMSCPGPPIALTCCLSMLPGKTLNRADLLPPTSECTSHCPGWSNGIWCCID